MTRIEVLALIGSGVLAALAIAFIHLQLRVPGHAILRATLPIVLGVALAPRRFAGTIAGLASAASVGLFAAGGVGNLSPAAVASLLAIGPAIDLATIGVRTAGPSLYLRFAAAGLLANLFAFAVRWSTAWFGLDAGRPHAMEQIGLAAFVSYAACGIAAGLISGAMCFRSTTNNR
jgi:hypothetical protein